MCGIFGWIPSEKYKRYDLQPTLDRVFRAIAHRGPDDRGHAVFKTDSEVGAMIGQVRLSIIDLSSAGHQPMFTPDGRYAIVYNGEVYNYIELRRELEKEGVIFSTDGDTEVVLNAVVHWGESALNKFVGMFAFVVFDNLEKTLFCARDFFGIKPFYWHRGDMGFCFASELPALLEFPDIPRELDPTNAYRYLCFGNTDRGDGVMLKNIYQLPPAHYMKIDISNPYITEPVRYWKPDLSIRSKLSFDDAAAQLREMFLNSVRMHLRSDVPLGVALSGGIDSSAVTCAVRYLEPNAELHTFSYIAKGTPVSEEHYADIVASHTRAIRHTVEVEPHELVNDLDSLIRHLGEPFGSTSIYAQYRVFQLAKDCGIKVTLDGQGADELLAGYFGYPGQRMATLLGNFQFAKAYKFLKAISKLPKRSMKLSLILTAWEMLPNSLIPLARKLMGQKRYPNWLDVEALATEGGDARGTKMQEEKRTMFPSQNKVTQRMAYQLTWCGIPNLLRHGDRNAMAHSVESRVPFLTKDIAEFCLALPEEYLIDMNGTTKSVFRAAMRGIVPDEILDRKDKIGFETPEQDWFMAISGWIDETLAGAGNVPYLKMDEVKKEWQAVKQNRAKFDWRIWRWINYIRWLGLFDVS